MKVTRISVWHVPLTSHAAYYMAGGKTCDTVETVVIALDTDAGRTGWGEVCPIPQYLPAYATVQLVRPPLVHGSLSPELWTNLLVMVAYTAVAGLVAARLFRWAPKA